MAAGQTSPEAVLLPLLASTSLDVLLFGGGSIELPSVVSLYETRRSSLAAITAAPRSVGDGSSRASEPLSSEPPASPRPSLSEVVPSRSMPYRRLSTLHRMDRMEEDTFARRLDHTITRRLSAACIPTNDGNLSPRSMAQLSFKIRTMNSTPMLGSGERRLEALFGPPPAPVSVHGSDALSFAISPAPSGILISGRPAIGPPCVQDEEDTVNRLTKKHIPLVALLLFLSLGVVIFVSLWEPHHPRSDVHRTKLEKYNMFISSPMYVVSEDQNVTLPFERDARAVDIKVVASKDGPPSSEVHEGEAPELSGRLLRWQLWYDPALRDVIADSHKRQLAGAEAEKMLYDNSLQLHTNFEAELFENVDLVPIFNEESISTGDGRVPLKLLIWVDRDGPPISFLFEPLLLGNVARYRVVIAGILFLATFILIITEKIHRVYATFIGSMLGLFLIALLHEVPELMDIMAMVDFGTLMLLFSMMVNVLSAFLDNVTTVMLVGPVTISLCKEIKRSPVPFYLSETLLATIGGTATLIGDPPNVVIGSKLGISFTDFIIYNGPLVVLLLPSAAGLLYLRFKSEVSGKAVLDEERIKKENIIHDKVAFAQIGSLFIAIILALFLSPVHGYEAAWFTLLGMYVGCIVLSPHDIHRVLEAVEWDTLIFFASLFVLVEAVNELGLIRALGDLITDIITSVPISHRLWVSQLLILWVSAMGSAFLESLPYTTTVAYILINIQGKSDLGIPVAPLAYALSVGACVGGIGSIMGSSANLVCMAISQRYSTVDNNDDKNSPEKETTKLEAVDENRPAYSSTGGVDVNEIHHIEINRTLFGHDEVAPAIVGASPSQEELGVPAKRHPITECNNVEAKHFLQYGFPLLLCLMLICSVYQVIVFEVIGAANDMPDH
ncbi:protein kinase [Perkinsus chesapeaki]|uniref:Protein kinase n=1 Tax=Perkinsus chesapeaki TaxID=330153 RepID=A0A7J6MZR6_PERCH|nr:protein kinase [Perkinsus chesapeaki]